MPVQPFGKADPQYDALRVFSQQALEAGPGDGTTTPGGGLENKIYLWPADGTTISTYDPTEAGIDTVIVAAAATPGTIWLPSIAISCTSQKTIPANVAVKGLSHNSVLNFSGFSDPAIVLSAGSIIQDFTLNHEDGQWFDASEADSKALRIHGTAQRAIVGSDMAHEVWFGTRYVNGNSIWYSEDYFDASSPTWNEVSAPAGAPTSNPTDTNNRYFHITPSGTTAYWFVNRNSGDLIYKTSTPKTPSWSVILSIGDITPYGTISGYFNVIIGPFAYDGESFMIGAHVTAPGPTDDWIVGTYNGTAWTWYETTNPVGFSYDSLGPDFYAWDSCGTASRVRGLVSGMYDYSCSTSEIVGTGGTAGWWRGSVKTLSGKRLLFAKLSGIYYVRDIDAATQATLGAYGSHNDEASLQGVPSGDYVYAVTELGVLWASSDGATFSSIATWSHGFVSDSKLSGGGSIVWHPRDTIDNGTISRLYSQAGSLIGDKTGDFWSVADHVTHTMIGLGLVY